MSQRPFTPKILQLDSTKTKLTSVAGLGTLIEAFDVSPLSKEFEKCLPERTSHRSQGAYCYQELIKTCLALGVKIPLATQLERNTSLSHCC